MGIADHGNYIKWFEIGRTEYLRQIGHPYAELEKEGIWLPLAEIACKYRQPALYDDVLQIACWPRALGGASVLLAYEIRRKATGELLAEGTTRHGVTDPDLKPLRLKKLRPAFYAVVAGTLEGPSEDA
jgi:acyl-CoA thioester hydrolase